MNARIAEQELQLTVNATAHGKIRNFDILDVFVYFGENNILTKSNHDSQSALSCSPLPMHWHYPLGPTWERQTFPFCILYIWVKILFWKSPFLIKKISCSQHPNIRMFECWKHHHRSKITILCEKFWMESNRKYWIRPHLFHCFLRENIWDSYKRKLNMR